MNQLDLRGRVAVVTGGARGIGRAIAERMTASGASVALWDMDEREAQATAEHLAGLLGGQASAHRVDQTDEAGVQAAAEATLARHGAVDILVNNAGITGGNAPTWQLPSAEWRRVIEVNLIGPYLACSAIVPHMLERGYGRVVNIASVAGKEGNPNASHYSASKAGLIALTKSLGKELAGKGVLVNCVTPAAAKTDIFKQMSGTQIDYMLSKIPMGRFVEVEEIAALACWLATEECSFSTGGVFDITGGRATY
jgi:3-oxoacyl-[acyl-carrier protein] reductase